MSDTGKSYPDLSQIQLPEQDDDTISLLDLVAVVAKRWKMIFLVTFLSAVGVAGFLLYTARAPEGFWNPLPNFYETETKLLFRQATGGQLSLGSLVGGGAANLILGGVGDRDASDPALARSLLQGNTLLDVVVDEFELINPEAEDPVRARRSARSSVRNAIEFEAGAGNVYTLKYTGADPEQITLITNRLVDILQGRFRRINEDTVSQKRLFLERRIPEIEEDLRNAQVALFRFQSEYGILNLDEESRQMINQVTELTREIIRKEVEIESLLEYMDPDSPQIRRLRNDIAAATRLIESLRRGQIGSLGRDEAGNETVAAQMVEQMNLTATVRINQELLTLTTTQLEEAKIDEQEQSRRFYVLEQAEVPVRRAGPDRRMRAIVTTIAAFFLAIFLAFVMEYLDRVKQDPEESRKLAVIRDSLPLPRRRGKTR